MHQQAAVPPRKNDDEDDDDDDDDDEEDSPHEPFPTFWILTFSRLQFPRLLHVAVVCAAAAGTGRTQEGGVGRAVHLWEKVPVTLAGVRLRDGSCFDTCEVRQKGCVLPSGRGQSHHGTL
jgi:hypothetical protein